jgi:dsRNA-specific ribonuclease
MDFDALFAAEALENAVNASDAFEATHAALEAVDNIALVKPLVKPLIVPLLDQLTS